MLAADCVQIFVPGDIGEFVEGAGVLFIEVTVVIVPTNVIGTFCVEGVIAGLIKPVGVM